MNKLFDTLKQHFDLGEKELAILRALEQNKLSAPQLCKETSIPQGRVYDYLNVLISAGLIQRSKKRPYSYSISDMKQGIMDYTQKRIESLILSQSQIMHALEQGTDHLRLIGNAAQFTQAHLGMITEGETIRIMCIRNSFPYLLYAEDISLFMKMCGIVAQARPTITQASEDIARLVYTGYMKALEQGKKILVLFDKDTLDFHVKLFMEKLSKQDHKIFIQGMQDRLKTHNVQIYVSNDPHPMQIDISDQKVCISMRTGGTTNAILLSGKETAAFFSRFFDEKCNSGTPLAQVFKSKL